MPSVDYPDDLLTVAASEGYRLLSAAEIDWTRPVPHCPDWDAAGLVAHMGGILAWIATIVTTGERVARRDREVAPAERDRLADWYSRHLDRTLQILRDSNPNAATWTFSTCGVHCAGWWRRRLAVEIAIHRWDAQHANASHGEWTPQPLDGHVAAAGIEEFMVEFLPGLLDTAAAPGSARIGGTPIEGTLHLHATDGDCEWWVDLGAHGQAQPIPGHALADTALRGTRSDLLLWLTNREPTTALELLGRPEPTQLWTHLRR